MPGPQFHLDERSIILQGETDASQWARAVHDWLSATEQLLEMNVAADVEPNVWVTNEVWQAETSNGKCVSEILFEPEWHGVARDTVLHVQRVVDRCSQFDPVELPDLPAAITHGHGAMKCVSCTQWGGFLTRRGRQEIAALPGWKVDAHFVACALTHIPSCIRQWIISLVPEPAGVSELLPTAFSNLYFHQSRTLEKFYSDFKDKIEKIVSHLSFLNDHAQALFAEHKGQVGEIEKQAMSGFGVELSPESPNTRKNAKAMQEREITVADMSICCEWHTKIYWDRGRIHFHPGGGLTDAARTITGGRLIIGPMVDHLTT